MVFCSFLPVLITLSAKCSKWRQNKYLVSWSIQMLNAFFWPSVCTMVWNLEFLGLNFIFQCLELVNRLFLECESLDWVDPFLMWITFWGMNHLSESTLYAIWITSMNQLFVNVNYLNKLTLLCEFNIYRMWITVMFVSWQNRLLMGCESLFGMWIAWLNHCFMGCEPKAA